MKTVFLSVTWKLSCQFCRQWISNNIAYHFIVDVLENGPIVCIVLWFLMIFSVQSHFQFVGQNSWYLLYWLYLVPVEMSRTVTLTNALYHLLVTCENRLSVVLRFSLIIHRDCMIYFVYSSVCYCYAKYQDNMQYNTGKRLTFNYRNKVLMLMRGKF